MQAGLRSTKAGIILGSARCPVNLVDGAVAAAGSDQSDAAALHNVMNVVSGADGTVGVILPGPGVSGREVRVYNAGTASALKVYPPSGGTINGGTEDAAISVAPSTLALLTCMDGTNWAASYTTV